MILASRRKGHNHNAEGKVERRREGSGGRAGLGRGRPEGGAVGARDGGEQVVEVSPGTFEVTLSMRKV